MTRRWIAAAALVLLGLGALLWALPGPHDVADRTDTELVEMGRHVYVAHCASCHGVRLEGQPDWRERRPDGKLPAPPHDASGHTWHHSDRQLFEITKHGVGGIVPGYRSDMPAYAGVLSDREIWAVIAYIKASWPPHIRSRQPRGGS